MTAPAYATPRDPHARTMGPAVAVVAKHLGTPLMPWQRQVADVAMELHPDDPGRWRYPLVIVTVPRQSGKTTLLRAVAVERAMAKNHARVFMTAQSGKDAHQRWKDTIERVESSVLGPHVTVNRAAGAPTLTLPNRSQVRSFAPTPKSIHGETPELVMVDEAWAFDSARGEDLMGAIRPAQITLPDRQLWLVSTMGDADSTFLHGWIDAGRAATFDPGSSVAFFEWSAPEGTDAYDPETWKFHPALGHTITLDALQQESETATRGTWERAFMNRRTSTTESVIDVTVWDTFAGAQTPPPPADLVLAYDCTQTDAAVWSAWRDAAGLNIRLVGSGSGPAWATEYVKNLHATLRPRLILADDGGPTRGTTDDLRREGVPVETLGPRDFGTACSTMLRYGRKGGLVHDGSPEIREAWEVAALRFIADQEAFDRRRSAGPVHHLVAAAVAARGVDHGAPPMPTPDIRF